MKKLRPIIFWMHLVLGLGAGLVIALTAFTGASMAFEKQLVAWGERDLRRVDVPATNTARISLDEVLAEVRDEWPDFRPLALTVSSDPAAAVIVNLGRNGNLYADPYTGKIREQGARRLRAFFQWMLRLHRWLGVAAPQGGPEGARPAGGEGKSQPITLRQVTSTVVGVSACVFLVLSISGLVLWWPRSWTWKNWRAVSVPALRLSGKARDWNWHNALGFWFSPVIIIITSTGMLMSFHGLADLLYKRPEGDGAVGTSVTVPTPAAGEKRLGPQALFAVAAREITQWEEITVRLGNGRRTGGREGGPRRGGGEGYPTQVLGEGRRPGGEGAGNNPGPQAAMVSVRRKDGWSPLPTQLQMDPYNGAILRSESLADMGFRRGLRTLNKPLHTGEAGGWVGQGIVMLGAVGSLVLVYTGLALALRRFARRKSTGEVGEAVALSSKAVTSTTP